VLSYWREFGGALRDGAVCAARNWRGSRQAARAGTSDSELEQIALAVPPMAGAEYLTATLLADLWHRINADFDVELTIAQLTVQESSKTAVLPGKHPSAAACADDKPERRGAGHLATCFLDDHIGNLRGRT
jgi:hypothetical protein